MTEEEREIVIVKRENGRVKQLLKDRGRELDAKNKTIEELEAKIQRLEETETQTLKERSFYKTNRSGD